MSALDSKGYEWPGPISAALAEKIHHSNALRQIERKAQVTLQQIDINATGLGQCLRTLPHQRFTESDATALRQRLERLAQECLQASQNIQTKSSPQA